MSTWKRNALVLRTYGKQKTKVEKWLSPDIRKKAFSSTSSSDLSVGEQSNIVKPVRTRKKTQSTACSKSMRTAKMRALTALRVMDSDEENVFIPETGQGLGGQKRKKTQSTACSKSIRTAKLRALTALSVMDSDEENVFIPETGQDLGGQKRRVNPFTKSVSNMRKREGPMKLSNSGSQDDEQDGSKEPRSGSQKGKTSENTREDEKCAESSNGGGLPSGLEKFVTDRRRMNLKKNNGTKGKRMKTKSRACTFNSSCDWTNDFRKSPRLPPRRVAAEKFILENKDVFSDCTRSGSDCAFSDLSHTQNITKHISRGRAADGTSESCYKTPLLTSTPSLAHKLNCRYYDPSVSEISFINEEEDVLRSNVKSARGLSLAKPPRLQVLLEKNMESQPDALEHVRLSKTAGKICHSQKNSTTSQHGKKLSLASNSVKGETTQILLETDMSNACQAEVNEVQNGRLELKDLKHKENSSVIHILSQSTNSLSHCELLHEGGEGLEPSYDRNNRKQHLKQANGHQVAECSMDLFAEKVQQVTSESCQGLVPPVEDSLMASVDSLSAMSPEAIVKERCITLQPVVRLQSLDLSERNRNSRLLKGDGFDSAPNCNFKEKVAGTEAEMLRGCSGKEEMEHKLNSSNLGLRRKLCSMFTSSADEVESSSFDSPPGGKRDARDVSRLRAQESSKDKQGTGRKACVTGLSVNRWTKKGHQRPRKGLTQSLLSKTQENPSDSSFALNNRRCFDTMNIWLQGTSGLFPRTSVHSESMNVSSLLAGLSPNRLTAHTWNRLKAALSVHKKRKAFFSPKSRLLSCSRFSECELLGVSRDFLTPGYSPNSNPGKSRLLSAEGTHLDITDGEKVYQECQQEGPIPFGECISPEKMKHCMKIGEGTFGEVFSTIGDSMETVALKIIPIEGNQKVNGEDQKTFGEVLHEIIISKELGSLGVGEKNQTEGFIELKNLHCVRGSYPELLLQAWDKFDKRRGSENDRPDFFGEDQLFLILEFEFGGSDLESMNGELLSLAHAKSILHQVTAALAVAEQALCFEHRDLHWGNILVKTTKQEEGMYILNGIPHRFETKGVLVSIIDYSLSRLEIDDLTVSCDISTDEELFMGEGDYQFDIYRKMREENNNSWSQYNPHTNVLWLHYLVDKLLSMRYKRKALSKPLKNLKRSLTSFYNEVLEFNCATNVLECSSLFE